MKRFKLMLLLIVVIVLASLFSLSNYLIRKSGDWVKEDRDTTIETIETESDLMLSTEEETFATDIVLSNGERLYENEGDSELKLLSGADSYERVCNQIVNLSGDIFNQIPESSKTDTGNMCYYRILENPTLNLSNFPEEGYSRFFIENSLTVIGLYRGTTAILVYNYNNKESKELVVADYSNSEVRNGMDDFISLGQVVSISASKDKIKVVPILDYQVLFVKG